MTALVWFRRDLRAHDHPALRAALDAHDEVVPFFCFDDRLLHGRHASGPRTQFLLECLQDLASSVPLVILRGRPEEEIPKLARRRGADELHFTADVSPFARRRRLSDLDCVGHPGLNVVDDVRSIETQGGKPYTVYSPFLRTWKELPRREVIGKPGMSGEADEIPALADLGLEQEVSDPRPGGEKAGRKRMHDWIRDGVDEYDRRHDQLAADRTSRLSSYLHFGCVSPRELESLLPADGEGSIAFRRQLCWRDFYHHVLYHFPGNARSEFQERYRGSIRWSYAEEAFERWTQGQTGFPLVDAGMRQLGREGWMHNRARLVVGSFLTKDLGIDWRWGERWFMRLLIDGDEANNNGNWQWIASVGVDPQPAYRRIYNPARHMERFDADGDYVRRHVPELREVPDRYLAEPWEMPREVQEEAGCVIGSDYPKPMVDHKAARQEALERYRL